ncbi:MAG: TIGR00269 family protein [Nanoarchaeota archaeon]|nr:TIGR00269 family protein [Nanoarchaeota archaeon]
MNIEQQVKKTIEKYHLIEKNDKVAVALSGGKDSTSVLYILHKLGYNVEGLMIDLHLGEWSKIHRKNMEKFCSELNIKLTIVDLKQELGMGICFIKSVLKQQKNLTGCTVCGIIKKWILNKWAKKLKADKIVTGHNLDDECQTVLMNFLKGNIYLGVNSTPATGIPNKGFVQRIKPLFFIPENEVRSYAKKMNFPILYEKCPCAIGTYRVETREWINFLTNKEKLNIVDNFQKTIPKLRRTYKTEIKNCKECGEPSKSDLCNACKIFQVLKNPKKS